MTVTTVAANVPEPEEETSDCFISVEDLGNYLGLDLSADDAAPLAVEAGCDTVRTIAEQFFSVVEDDVVTLDGTGTDALLLPERPVTDVKDVIESDEALAVVDDYRLNANGILLRTYPLVWIRARQNVVVTYTHGYADIPNDLRMVALTLAARLHSQGPAVFEVLGQHQVRYNGPASDLTGGEMAILAKYKQAK